MSKALSAKTKTRRLRAISAPREGTRPTTRETREKGMRPTTTENREKVLEQLGEQGGRLPLREWSANQLQEDLFKLGLLHDDHPIARVVLSRQGVIQGANDAAAALFACSPERILFRGFADFLPTVAATRFLRFLKTCAEAKQLGGDFELETNPGSTIPVRVVAKVRPGANERAFFQVALLDRREDLESRPRIEAQSDFLQLVNTIEGVVWKAEYPMRFTFVSRHAERMLGYPAEAWLGASDFWEKNIHWEDRERIVRARQLAVRSGKAHTLEYRMLRSDRRLVWVRDSATVKRASAEEVSLSGMMADISALKEAQDKLAQNARELERAVEERTAKLQAGVRSMDLFCYGIAHDLKAPLRTMSAYSDLLAEDYASRLDAAGRDYLGRIAKAARHFGSLVDALLKYGRLNHERVRTERVDLESICEQAVDTLRDEARAKGARIHTHCSPLAVEADRTLVQEVLVNLIGNALKFARPHVRPVIFIESHPAPDQEHRRRGFVRVTVTDNGVGISEGDFGKVFGVFERLAPRSEVPGTGIGLAMVKRAVELMNGRVGVYSQPDQGSTFWFELPGAAELRAPGRAVAAARAQQR